MDCFLSTPLSLFHKGCIYTLLSKKSRPRLTQDPPAKNKYTKKEKLEENSITEILCITFGTWKRVLCVTLFVCPSPHTSEGILG